MRCYVFATLLSSIVHYRKMLILDTSLKLEGKKKVVGLSSKRSQLPHCLDSNIPPHFRHLRI